MGFRKIRLADHRGLEATVLLTPRKHKATLHYADAAGNHVKSTRLIKTSAANSLARLDSQYDDSESVVKALIDGDPELDLDITGSMAGACDRVFIDSDGKPLYSARFVEVTYDANGKEINCREPVNTPSNLVADTPPHFSGKLISKNKVLRKYTFTRSYQVRHTNGLEYDFLYNLAAYLENQNALALVGSGQNGTGPLICERNAIPMKGFLEGRTQGDMYLLVLHLASFELKVPESSTQESPSHEAKP